MDLLVVEASEGVIALVVIALAVARELLAGYLRRLRRKGVVHTRASDRPPPP